MVKKTNRFELNLETLKEGEKWLLKSDPKLARWMKKVEGISLRRKSYQFGALCQSIVSQQISAQAAKTIYGRFLEMFPDGKPDPLRLGRVTENKLKSCGLSKQKTSYLKSLAHEYVKGDLGSKKLGSMSEDEVIQHLTKVKGIGVWTAEMFLIFSLGRIDVFSVGDLALRSAVEKIENKKMAPRAIEIRAQAWSPYRSVASLYLWKISQL